MITFTHKGNFSKTDRFFEKILNVIRMGTLDKYGEEGVRALADATPIDSGKTAKSWEYEIVRKQDSVTIEWHNTNTNDGRIVAILLQYGHGTKSGGFVRGIDYVNPAMKPLFDKMADDAWKEIKNA